MSYFALKHLHVLCAVLTSLSFLIRGAYAISGAAWLSRPVVRIAPHIIDSLLLLAAIGMLWVGGLNPLTTPWILAKIGLLMAYVVVATIAIRRGQTVKTRAQAYGVSIGILLTLFAVAGMKPSFGLL